MNSPRSIWRCTPERACVSTSSVKKTLVTPSRRMTEVPLLLMRTPPLDSSFQSDAVEGVPGGHIGDDDLVAGFQTLEDLDGVDGALSEADLHPHGLVVAGLEPEESDRALLGPEGGAADVDDVGQPLELDCAVYRKVGPGALWERAVQGGVDSDGSAGD